MSSTRVVRAATGMGAAAAVSRALGALRVLVIAAVLGATNLGNAFGGANSFSNVLFELLAAGALSAVLVPPLVGLLRSGNDSAANELTRQLLGVALVGLGALAVASMFAAGWISQLLTSGVTHTQTRIQQEHLTTILLWWFIPQVVLYGLGAVATAALHARNRFMAVALAPIGNTIAMVALLGVFRSVAGASPGLSLSGTEQTLLGLAGTLGVVAFVATPSIAAVRSGVDLWPSFRWDHADLRPTLAASFWASVQHACAALLLGGAIIFGGGVAGGVVAYQVGWFFFLAPYGIVAQPLHTTLLPELVDAHQRGDSDAFVQRVRWAIVSMGTILIPLSGLCVALARPGMEALAFGESATPRGVVLLAAAMGSLGLGLFPYGVFFLLSRAYYARAESRVPAIAGVVIAIVGVSGMALAAVFGAGSNVVWGLGIAHTCAYVAAVAFLSMHLGRRCSQPVLPVAVLIPSLLTAVLTLLAWQLQRWWSPAGRGESLLATVAIAGAVGVLYLVVLRQLGGSLSQRRPGAT